MVSKVSFVEKVALKNLYFRTERLHGVTFYSVIIFPSLPTYLAATAAPAAAPGTTAPAAAAALLAAKYDFITVSASLQKLTGLTFLHNSSMDFFEH